jgi:hypothetical protein
MDTRPGQLVAIEQAHLSTRERLDTAAVMRRQQISFHGRRGFQVHRNGQQAFVANTNDAMANLRAAIWWAEEHPEAPQ